MIPDLKSSRPAFTPDQAQALAREHFGVQSKARELPSERDQNFHLLPEDSLVHQELVLKIANAKEDRTILDLQHAALAHLHESTRPLFVPEVLLADGRDLVTVHDGRGRHFLMRLLSYLPGRPLKDVSPHPESLLQEVGAFFGRVDRALESFDHPAMDRRLYWDLRHAGDVIPEALELIPNDKRRLVEDVLRDEREIVEPIRDALPVALIHNDANDHNVIVNEIEDRWVVGAIDFGDMVRTAVINELANACAYAMLDKTAPLEIASAVIRGYNTHRALSELEIRALPTLIRLRLALSVANSARQSNLEPDRDYLRVSENAAWALLERLDAVPSKFAVYHFRAACGLDPYPEERRLHTIIDAAAQHAAPLFGEPLTEDKTLVLDLSVGSPELGNLECTKSVESFESVINRLMVDAGATIALGRYGEPRLLYQDGLFTVGGRGHEPRTVHLGVDLFAAAGTAIHAPLDGVVASACVNDGELNYGPTLIVEHDLQGLTLFSLYGHLSIESLQGRRVGSKVGRGEMLARIGNYPTNGNWPPHLHFQLLTDRLGMEGDFPGVARASERETWLSLCPDPNLLLRLPRQCFVESDQRRMPASTIRTARRSHLSETLSLSYAEPLHIVRGRGAYLFDVDGHAYLDMVNNVCHVGHCHPRVVGAGQTQLAVLNTNTRYLHENIVRYAERLTAKCPDELSVCFLVNSGSEANDLALRLARIHTGAEDVLVLDGAYHGNLSSLIDISPYKFDGPGGKGSPPRTHKLTMPDPFRGRLIADNATTYDFYIDELNKTLDELGNRDVGVMGMIAEAIMSCGGQIVFPKDYLRRAYDLVGRAGGVRIADEVQVGFGRVGERFWAFEVENAVPDIMTVGKPIGNGHPLGAVLTTTKVAASFQTGMEYFNTYGGNPVSCAIGLAVLDVIEEEGLQENALRIGATLLSGLSELALRFPIIGDVRGRGLFLGFELVNNRETLDPAAAQARHLVNRLRQRGILNNTDGPFHNVIKLKPPMVFDGSDADFYLETLESTLSEDAFRVS